jgi:hypothetical protein
MTFTIRKLSSSIALLALITAPVAGAQVSAPAAAPAFAVAQASDTALTCGQLAMEIMKTANMVASSATAAAAPAPVQSASATEVPGANALANAINQAQLNNQLGNLQLQAARAGINPGTSSAAIGGLAALAAAASSGEGAAEGAKQAAANMASKKLAQVVPGGALIGGLVGGMFGKKKKAKAAAAAAAAETNAAPAGQMVQLGQQRMAFLQSLSVSKSCN